MWKHNFKQAFVKLIKYRNLSILNILGLGFGLACSIILFLWIKKELSYETCFTNADRICQAYLKGISKDGTSFQTTTSPKIATLLKSNYPEVIDATRIGRLDEMAVKSGDKIFVESQGGAADPNYFKIFNYSFISGNPATVLSKPYSVVLTKSFSEKFFGTENPIGKSLTFNNKFIFTVTGLLEDLPDNAYRKFDFMVPFNFLKELGNDIEGFDFFPCSYVNYALLREGTNIAALSSKTEHDIQTKNEFIKFEISLKPLKDTYLQETNGKTKVIIFLAIAVLILLVACINSINLITGQYFNNLKGIGLRKVIGANKLHLIKQTTTETFFHAFIAIILALVFVKIAIGLFNNLSNESLSLSLVDPVVIAGLFAILLVTALITGLFPAFLISSFKPVNILKNKLNYRFSKGSVSASFIVFQFVVTIFFIITVLTLKKQNNLIDAFHLGYDKTNIVYVRLDGDIKQNIPVVKEELLKSPLIKSVTVASELPGNVYSGSYFDWGIDEIKAQRICELEVDRDFIKTLDIQMVAGSFFKEDNETNSIVVNQNAIKAINEIDPIGKIFKYRGKPYTLIGVLKDFQHGSPLNLSVAPMVFRLKPEDNNYLLIKTKPSANNVYSGQEAMSFIKKTCDSYSVEWPIQYQYLDDFAPAAEKLFISRNNLITLSTFVVILISCFGLLGLVILSASQKTKEIGIRKVNGARVIEVMAMLNKDFVKWVAIAFVIASPIAWCVMNKWLQNFAYKTELSWWVFALAGIVAVAVAVLTVSWQSWRAATRNPVEALRYE